MNDETTTPNTDSDIDAASEAKEAVGKLLRDTREQAGLDIADVARVLRISQRYLEALEDGRNADLPGPTYAIGFVRSYAEHLSLDGEEIVRRYKSQAEGVDEKADLVFPKPIPDSGVPGAAVLGLGAIVAAIAYGVWYYNSSQSDVTVDRVEPVPERLVPQDESTAASTDTTAAVSEPQPSKMAADAANEQANDEAEAVAEAADQAVEDVQDTAEVAPQTTVDNATETAEAAAEEPVQQDEAAAEVPAQVAETTAQDTTDDTAQAVENVENAAQEVADTTSDQAEQVAQDVEEEAQDAPAAAEDAVASPPDEPTVSAPADEGPSRITIRAKSNSWIQVRDEALDRLLFTRLLRAGDEYRVPDRPGLQLMTGNAGALEILVDGEAVPPIGAVREVKRNVELAPDALKAGANAGQ